MEKVNVADLRFIVIEISRKYDDGNQLYHAQIPTSNVSR